MKKFLSLMLAAIVLLSVSAGFFSAVAKEIYPDGTLVIYSTGQPQFRKIYYEAYVKRQAPNVDLETVQIETMAAGRQKVSMDYLAGAYDDMPEVIMLDAIGIVDLASAGLPTNLSKVL